MRFTDEERLPLMKRYCAALIERMSRTAYDPATCLHIEDIIEQIESLEDALRSVPPTQIADDASGTTRQSQGRSASADAGPTEPTKDVQDA